MSVPSLEARHVSRAFGSLKAVDDVSLSIDAGQVVALLGQSGSGKSTLLRLFAGLESLDAGEIFADGSVVSRQQYMVAPEQRGLGMVFQDYALFPHLTAQGNVAFGLHGIGKSKAQSDAMDWLAKVGLENRASYFPHQLSGGEQQRVALARALAPSPRAVLMDEPFSGLDPQLSVDLQRTMVTTLREAGVAALIVSHDTEEAVGIADKIAIMDQGRIVQVDRPDVVFASPVSLQAARALGPVWSQKAHGHGGYVETAFGTFATSIRGPVIIGARPEATTFVPAVTGAFTTIDSRGVGRFVTTTLQGPGGVVQALVEARIAPAIGTCVNVLVLPADVFIFAANT